MSGKRRLYGHDPSLPIIDVELLLFSVSERINRDGCTQMTCMRLVSRP